MSDSMYKWKSLQAFIPNWDDDYEGWIPINPVTESKPEPVCECGSEHVGSPRHSTWCAKFDSNV